MLCSALKIKQKINKKLLTKFWFYAIMIIVYFKLGGMAEWFNAMVLKTIEVARLPGVRIPLPPPPMFGEMPEWFNGAAC